MPLDRYETLCQRTLQEFPRFNIRPREQSWLRPVFWLLGKLTRKPYTGFTTTIFSTVYVDPTWDRLPAAEKYATLRHEKKHIEQFHRWPLGRWAWPVNHLLVALCYLFVLPVLWTLRARFEREGYLQTLLVQYELEGRLSQRTMEENATAIADIFGGAAYFFMWRKKAAYAWAMSTQTRINAGDITNQKDRADVLPTASSA